MDIKNLANKGLSFIIKRIIELSGTLLAVISFLLFLSLITYSPEDPNFIFPENAKIQNILGFRGSFVSDFFIQSLGLISILIPISLFFTGINIIKFKQLIIIIENLFYIILYSLLGTLFFSIFYENSFWLPINGSGGFVGIFLENTFLSSIIVSNKIFSY